MLNSLLMVKSNRYVAFVQHQKPLLSSLFIHLLSLAVQGLLAMSTKSQLRLLHSTSVCAAKQVGDFDEFWQV